MKILKLRLENLNSLYGRWELDFSSAEYAGNGLFAIVGSTGAGKSTILDAVSLALYGRTPRLNVVSANNNEIMSRGTGECFAEAVFEIGQEVYVACWSQRRARKKADGKLQPNQHKLDNLTTSKAVSGKVNQTRKMIEELTGMNFEQFTRSILLAQGEFSKFLKASTGERSEILEKITNTEEYSYISKSVHERLREEENKLLELEAGLAGVKLLRDEELAELNVELEDLQSADNRYRTQEEDLRKLKVKYERLTALEEEFSGILREEEEFKQGELEFAAELLRLEKAEFVEKYWAEYEAIQELRELQTQDSGRIQHWRDKLSALSSRQEEAKVESELKQQELQALRREFEQEQLLIRQVRELDSRSEALKSRLFELRQEYAEVRDYVKNAAEKIAGDGEELEANLRQLQGVEKYLQEHEEDKALAGEFELIAGNMKRIRTDSLAAAEAEEELRLAEEQKKLAAAEYEGGVLEKESIARRCEEVRADIMKYEEKSSEISEGEGSSGIERKMAVVQSQLHQLEELGEILQDLQKVRSEVNGLEKKIRNCELGITLAKDEFEANAAERKLVEGEVAHLELELRLFDKIKNLQQRRAELIEGEPCPLCGSRKHPFVREGIPEAGEIEQKFVAEKSRLANIQNELELCKVSMTRQESDLENYHDLLITSVGRFELIQRDVLLRLDSLKISSENQDMMMDEIAEKRQKLEIEYTGFEDKVFLLRKYEEETAASRDLLNTLKDGLLGQEQIVGKLKSDMSVATIRVTTAQKDLAQCRKKLESVTADTTEIIGCYGDYTGIDLVTAQDEVLAELKERSKLYQQHKEQSEVCRSKYTALQSRLAEMRAGRERDCLRRDKLSRQLEELAADRDILTLRRRELYKEKDCDVEQERYTRNISRLEKLAVEAEDSFRKLRDSAVEGKARVAGLEATIAQRKVLLAGKEEVFFANIGSQGFADEITFLEHKLAPEILSLLCQQKVEREELQGSIRQRKSVVGKEQQRLQQELAEVMPYTEITGSLEQIIGLRSETSQKLGALRNTVKLNEQAQELFRERKERIIRQQDICRDWGNLHELIGSADGKKYRNFAQGLTFDIMLKHANAELSRMNDRYLLRRSDSGRSAGAELLDLDVIDKDQAGEVRSARNLSGGESFIVSLALALGLSGMSSRKVEVNSLFLDEGFGTLDEDELDKVLSALSRIQQQGKMIGIISHVPALKERIGVQISVDKGSGGRSLITGAGCRRI